jgi:hypothetical protein
MNGRDLKTREVIALAVAPILIVFLTIDHPAIMLPGMMAAAGVGAVWAIIRAVGNLNDPRHSKRPPDPP